MPEAIGSRIQAEDVYTSFVFILVLKKVLHNSSAVAFSICGFCSSPCSHCTCQKLTYIQTKLFYYRLAVNCEDMVYNLFYIQNVHNLTVQYVYFFHECSYRYKEIPLFKIKYSLENPYYNVNVQQTHLNLYYLFLWNTFMLNLQLELFFVSPKSQRIIGNV